MLQSGMREALGDTVELGDMDGAVLKALVSAMYGDFELQALNCSCPYS